MMNTGLRPVALSAVVALLTQLLTVDRTSAQSAGSIRAALASVGLSTAAAAADAPDLDEALSSWEFVFEDGLFVAGYYLQREMQNQLLGPLRVIAYDSVSERWLRASALEEGGSVLTVHVSRPYILLDLHGTPSSGTGLTST